MPRQGFDGVPIAGTGKPKAVSDEMEAEVDKAGIAQNSALDSPQRPAIASHNMAASLILVLEDEVLIGIDLEAMLVDAGFSVVLARSCNEAAEFLADNRPDAAVLDVLLTDGECTEAAKKLVAQGVPFVVHSALLGVDSDPVFQRGTFINKPAGTPDIVDVLKRIL
jgi:CheY-like chemotaxis protein